MHIKSYLYLIPLSRASSNHGIPLKLYIDIKDKSSANYSLPTAKTIYNQLSLLLTRVYWCRI